MCDYKNGVGPFPPSLLAHNLLDQYPANMALQMRTSHAGLAQRRAPRFTTRLSPSALPALAPRPVLARAYRQPLLSEVDVLRVTETESRQAEGETSIASPRLDAHQPHLETSPDFWSKAKSALGNLPKLAAVGALAVLLVSWDAADEVPASKSAGPLVMFSHTLFFTTGAPWLAFSSL